MRLGLPRIHARLATGVLMASCVAASAVLTGQHATPAEAATNTTVVADRIPSQDVAQVSALLAGAKPAAAKPAVATSAPLELSALLAEPKPAAVKPALAKPGLAELSALLGGAKPTPAKFPQDKPAPAKAAPAKPAPAQPAAPAKKTYANNLDGWIAQARDILAAHGDKVPSADAIHTRALTESSGNPRAENHWDMNQALYGGTFGLIQTIKPTFASYSLPGHKDIFNPVDNIIAGVRYANDRYGSFETVAYGKQGY